MLDKLITYINTNGFTVIEHLEGDSMMGPSVIVESTLKDLIFDAELLHSAMKSIVINPQNLVVEASYSPSDKSIKLGIYGIEDEDTTLK